MLIALILKKTQEQQMKNWDSQTRVMSELLANIKRCLHRPNIILCAWEYAFIWHILHVGNDIDLKMFRRIVTVTVLNTTLWGDIPLVFLLSFGSICLAGSIALGVCCLSWHLWS
ncbi:hypothetical protein PISMIDRAFT_116044 [Pisolithus microcarpus 441]|uniref:Uncharacterized protein n=1 Tax=Pisolithus microcarpus 441 TaxID=765257 RepID=A0A0C9XRR5_9AGAM|nr:hypothetical protein BKA83DRAFT_116044 [Pisolithus microcarpus]KIK14960.1 hypothetical protein PISMIDRAFT_116044 [Pisolithus microcarpus 441]